jgi:hypothetical protein
MQRRFPKLHKVFAVDHVLIFKVYILMFTLLLPPHVYSQEATGARESTQLPSASSSGRRTRRLVTVRSVEEHDATPSAPANPLFLPEVVYGLGIDYYCNSLVIMDLNLDRKPDLVACDPYRNTVAVFIGNGDGTFQTETTYDSGGSEAMSVAVADLNGDGKLDIIVANKCGTYYCSPTSSLGVLLGNGDGTFQPAVSYDSGGQNAAYVTVADVNGDGKGDLVVANDGKIGVLLGNGDGTFRSAVSYDSGGQYTASVAVADLNGDGKADLVVGNEGNVSVLLGNGDGTFQPPVSYLGANAKAIAIADLNRDGKPDLLVADFEGFVDVLLGNGNGTFQSAVHYNAGAPDSIAVADVNGDGKLDVAVGDGIINHVNVLLGNGDGTLQPVASFDSTGTFGSVSIADVNGDGRPDLVVGASQVGVLLNNTGSHSPTTVTLTSNANPVIVNQSVSYIASVTSASGESAGTVTFQDGGVTVANIPLAGNQAAYKTSYSAAPATHSIVAAYSGDLHNSSSISGTLAESVLASSQTKVSTSGSPSLVGQSVTFTATVKSKYGAIPDGGTVTFYAEKAALASVPLGGGSAAYTTSALPARIHNITASYAGSPTFAPSSGAVRQVVLAYTTTTSLVSKPNPSAYGGVLALTATVASSAPTGITGTVTFKNGSANIGTMPLTNGTATLATTKLPVGSDSLTVTYNGDSWNAKSTSLALVEVVKQATISMKLTSSPNPSALGRSVKFTATLTSNGGLPVGGMATFSFGSTTLGMAKIGSTGLAVFSTTALPHGSDVIEATYAGNSNYSAATASVTQTVN